MYFLFGEICHIHTFKAANYLSLEQITTVSLFNYCGAAKLWAFGQMQFAHARLRKVPGLEFYKMMGSGSGSGFSIQPDFSTYAFFGIWTSVRDAELFFSSNAYLPFRKRSDKQKHLYLKATKAHGEWDSQQPFAMNGNYVEGNRIAVLTRASISKRKMIRFWKNVPEVSRSIESAPGLIYSKGIGEWPIVEQATISLWENREAMYNFAYRNPIHVDVIRKTRELGWYTEELFAEFEVIREEGI
ncbi:MAG: hypothetical protein HKN16_01390 [Saprospiraceae bacterium]|nr:hypothetical protein [Saprospiraceae bacterium]